MSISKRDILRQDDWDPKILDLPHPHLLQSWLWGEIKQDFGWSPRRWVWEDEAGRVLAAAQILERRSPGPLPLSILYCPKGPLLDWAAADLRAQVLGDLEALAAKRGVVQLKVDPDLPLGFGIPGQEGHRSNATGSAGADHLRSRGWMPSAENVQFANTMILDLRPPEDDLLANMKQKTRYNVRLARRKGVTVREGTGLDLDLLYKMYAETSIRDGFAIRGPDYYRQVWGRFVGAGQAMPLIAEVDGEAVAALIVFAFGPTAWYMYGMSLDRHRERMPNYLLQWEAIRWARARGCRRYDLWGAPDSFDENDPLWGVYRFKAGFNARVVRTIGPWDFAPHRLIYWGYTVLLPRVMALLRRRGRRQTAELLD
jgi:peptidoglycan pentaglycine glycine transferase (the first glycine)